MTTAAAMLIITALTATYNPLMTGQVNTLPFAIWRTGRKD